MSAGSRRLRRHRPLQPLACGGDSIFPRHFPRNCGRGVAATVVRQQPGQLPGNPGGPVSTPRHHSRHPQPLASPRVIRLIVTERYDAHRHAGAQSLPCGSSASLMNHRCGSREQLRKRLVFRRNYAIGQRRRRLVSRVAANQKHSAAPRRIRSLHAFFVKLSGVKHGGRPQREYHWRRSRVEKARHFRAESLSWCEFVVERKAGDRGLGRPIGLRSCQDLREPCLGPPRREHVVEQRISHLRDFRLTAEQVDRIAPRARGSPRLPPEPIPESRSPTPKPLEKRIPGYRWRIEGGKHRRRLQHNRDPSLPQNLRDNRRGKRNRVAHDQIRLARNPGKIRIRLLQIWQHHAADDVFAARARMEGARDDGGIANEQTQIRSDGVKIR